FDGIYNHSEVWMNGHLVGGRPYGYSSFECDLTPFVKFGTAQNVLAVRVDHSRFADSRWYTGSGIYRHVRLRLTGKLHITPHGAFMTTPQIPKDSALIHVETEVRNDLPSPKAVTLVSRILKSDGTSAETQSTRLTLDAGTNYVAVQEITIRNPELWTLEDPK